MVTGYEMVTLFKTALELCAITSGEIVIVLTEGNVRADCATVSFKPYALWARTPIS